MDQNTLRCETCGEIFVRKSKYGQAPRWCPECMFKRRRVQRGHAPEAPMDLICADCGEEFRRPGGRGGIPERCAPCKKIRLLKQMSVRLRRRKYGITEAQFVEMLADQGGVCAICGTDNWGVRGPVIDHCHSSGKVRGILCNWCNPALGAFRDRVDLLKSAIEYLEAHHDSDLAASSETVDMPELS